MAAEITFFLCRRMKKEECGVLVKERKLHKNMFDVLKGEEDGTGIEKGRKAM